MRISAVFSVNRTPLDKRQSGRIVLHQRGEILIGERDHARAIAMLRCREGGSGKRGK